MILQAFSFRDPRPLAAPRRMLMAATLGLALALPAAAPVFAFGAPDSFADLAEKISPSVVNITTSTTVAAPAAGDGPVAPPGSPFEDFFRWDSDLRRRTDQRVLGRKIRHFDDSSCCRFFSVDSGSRDCDNGPSLLYFLLHARVAQVVRARH